MSMVELKEGTGFEILELNSHGMYNCQNNALDEAEEVLLDAYSRLQQDDAPEDPMFSDRLKAITLNNLGVVNCHKGQPRKALEHLEAAFALESRLGVTSPSTTLNLCAAHNAMKHYEKATQFALQTIEALHKVPPHELEEHKVLWGAAWHNLGIAQLNTAGNTLTESTTVFSIFRNAMKATQDLLGPKHPMTVAVHQTFRELRDKLKTRGVFNQHHTFPALNDREKELTVTLVGPDHYKYQQTTSNLAYTKPGSSQSPRKPQTASQRFSSRLHHTLKSSAGVYSELHPLLSAQQAAARAERRRAQTSEGNRRSPRSQVPSMPALPTPPRTANQAGTGRRSTPKAHTTNRRLSELLMGDMWVEVHGSNSQSLTALPTPPTSKKGDYYPPVRPTYGQAMYVMQPDEPHERVVDPQSNAELDHQVKAKPVSAGEQQRRHEELAQYTGLTALAEAIEAAEDPDDPEFGSNVRQLTSRSQDG